MRFLLSCVVSEKEQSRGWGGKQKFEALSSLDGKLRVREVRGEDDLKQDRKKE